MYCLFVCIIDSNNIIINIIIIYINIAVTFLKMLKLILN